MKNAQKPDHTSLNTLINWLRDGRFVVPDFQREFEWSPRDTQELMRSIFLDYYVGSLLLWKGTKENFDALSCEPIYGHTGGGNPEYIVLDGQQRLTALYYACLASDVVLPNRTSRAYFFINVERFMAEEYDDAFHYEWATKRWSKLHSNHEAQFAEHLFPMSVIGSGGWDLPNWVQGYERYWRDKATEAEASGNVTAAKISIDQANDAKLFGEHLKGITEQYQISYIELDQDLGIDRVCDIFTQINSRGVRLDVFDLMNALLKPKGLQLKHMWREASPGLEFVDTDKMNVYILQVMSILRQAYCSPKYLYFLLPGEEKPIRDPDGTRRKEKLIPDTADFQKRWQEAVGALDHAIDLLRHPQEFGAISSSYLPYVSILPAFAALQTHVKSIPHNGQLNAQRKVRHWYWASVFTNRYSRAVESTTARDFMNVKAWIDDDRAEPALLLEFKNQFRNLELRGETRRGTSVYNGIFNLLVLQGARDWMTGNVPQHDDLDDHHIVPASWGAKHLGGNHIHTILNRSPLSAETNRNVIKNRLPNEYLPELIAANGEQSVRVILESHFISPAAQEILLHDPFTTEDFEAFTLERQRTLQDAIENLLVKERLDLPPQLRQLDEKIEQVELGLRSTLHSVLHSTSAPLPQHVVQRVAERIQRAVNKNAALDAERYHTLDGKLEFFDLRELQDAITSKPLWPSFQERFANKDMLSTRFNQLAELRNGIRHSRTVDPITRKDGEAAIMWFELVLQK